MVPEGRWARLCRTLALWLAALACAAPSAAAQLGPGETAGRNLQLLANVPGTAPLATGTTDLAFWGNLAFQGNSSGFTIFDISNPAAPRAVSRVLCPGPENDISVWRNLLFLSVDSSRSDDSCASVAQSETIATSWEGLRVFDISDPANPRYVKSVETSCGSHTHTLVPDGNRVLIYVSSFGPNAAFPDCQPPHDRISIVQVPIASPAGASVIAQPVLFPDGGNPGGPGAAATTGCHDITVYPALGIAAGACMGDGVLLDISNPVNPVVRAAVRDPNFAFFHSATISHDGSKVLFTDERNDGASAECNAAAGPARGGDAIYRIVNRRSLVFQGYFKIPRAQAGTENCMAANGNLLPLRSRDILAQAWYQGGTSVFDWTDGRRVLELAWFDRGPSGAAGTAGAWSSYWYNGRIYSSEVTRGLDVLRLTGLPTLLTLVSRRLPYLNPQTQEPLPRLWG